MVSFESGVSPVVQQTGIQAALSRKAGWEYKTPTKTTRFNENHGGESTRSTHPNMPDPFRFLFLFLDFCLGGKPNDQFLLPRLD